jgi:hypothetical protein
LLINKKLKKLSLSLFCVERTNFEAVADTLTLKCRPELAGDD